MHRVRVFAFVLLGCLLPLQAGVLVDTSLSLTQLQILPSAGTVQFILPLTASGFAEAINSQGGLGQDFQNVDNGVALASATVDYASATGAASAIFRLAGADSHIFLPTIDASANSTARGTLSGSFQIVDTVDPVSVQVIADLLASLSLSTDSFGLLATSEVVFSLLLPDISPTPFLTYSNNLSIGPSTTLNDGFEGPLSNSIVLQPNTPYRLIIEVDAESFGLSQSPEPSSWLLAGAGAALIYLRRKK